MTCNAKRILIGGTNSGCGKTTVTCAILRALQRRGLRTASFKCGPDYIDPMFHSKVIGTKSRNIDFFLCGEQVAKYLFVENSLTCDLAVVEGVMGFYDGLGGRETTASSWDVSQKLGIPAVLVVDCKGASLSVAAVVKGFLEFRQNRIVGVILNGISAGMFPIYRDILEENLPVKVLGYLPKEPNAALESRHLGLVTADEVTGLQKKLDRLADLAEKYIDLDSLLRLAGEGGEFSYEPMAVKKCGNVRIAYALDRAFCFYYEDALMLLERLGATLVPFSPLTDSALPSDIGGVIFGGGYPELYIRELSQNTEMLASIRQANQQKMPIYGECGGFMYLMEQIEDAPMCGVIGGSCRMTKKLQNFGYATLSTPEKRSLLNVGEAIPGHEFHYSACDLADGDLIATKSSGKNWQVGYCRDNIFAMYPHLHFWGTIPLAERFVEKCVLYANHTQTLSDQESAEKEGV